MGVFGFVFLFWIRFDCTALYYLIMHTYVHTYTFYIVESVYKYLNEYKAKHNQILRLNNRAHNINQKIVYRFAVRNCIESGSTTCAQGNRSLETAIMNNLS